MRAAALALLLFSAAALAAEKPAPNPAKTSPAKAPPAKAPPAKAPTTKAPPAKSALAKATSGAASAKPTAKPSIDVDNSDAATESVHVVREGETLGGIANRAKVPRILIAEANGLKPPYALRLGQKLQLPRTGHHKVQPGESSFEIAYRYGLTWKAIAAANGLEEKSKLKPGQDLLIPTVLTAKPAEQSKAEKPSDTPTQPSPLPTASASPAAVNFAWPLRGKILRGFKPRGTADFHDGLDIDAKEGDPIKASADGKVIYAQAGPKIYGLAVVIQHGQWATTYAYLSKISVALGDTVKAGDQIGLAGHSGLANTNQLHFEIRNKRAAVDPLKKLPKPE